MNLKRELKVWSYFRIFSLGFIYFRWISNENWKYHIIKPLVLPCAAVESQMRIERWNTLLKPLRSFFFVESQKRIERTFRKKLTLDLLRSRMNLKWELKGMYSTPATSSFPPSWISNENWKSKPLPKKYATKFYVESQMRIERVYLVHLRWGLYLQLNLKWELKA